LDADKGVIVGLSGQYAGLRAKCPWSCLTIGSDSRAELRVEGEDVSPVHAGLLFQAGTWYCYDLGSQTGTFVQGNRIENRLFPLLANDVVRVGSHEFMIEYEPVPAPEPIRTRRRFVTPEPGSG